MVCNTLRAAASVLAEHMAMKRDQSICIFDLNYQFCPQAIIFDLKLKCFDT